MVQLVDRKCGKQVLKRILANTVWLVILIGLVGIIFIFFYYSRSPHRSLFIKPIDRFETEERVAALNFTGGPSENLTPFLLDLLKKYNVKVNFFIVGEKAEKLPELSKRIVKEGHLMGSNAYKYTHMALKTPSYISRDLDKTDRLIKSFGYDDTSYYTPPFGDEFFVLPYILKEKNKRLVTWDLDPLAQYDNRRNMQGDEVYKYVANNVRPGSVILLQEGWEGNRKPWLDAVEKIIMDLQENGYRFVTLQEGINLEKKQLKINSDK
ncbi:MAG: polysaccharide deacetylase family protein [Clostridia bacterium]|nr:polysaccharide deacetylase family protein [Clostridia bacterium]